MKENKWLLRKFRKLDSDEKDIVNQIAKCYTGKDEEKIPYGMILYIAMKYEEREQMEELNKQ